MQRQVDNVYITLDSVLDTRAGTIIRHYPDKQEYVFSDSYLKRIIDQFDGIPDEHFKKLYKERDVQTLHCSIVTNITLLLAVFNKSSKDESVQGYIPADLCIHVNIFPYLLSEEEKTELKEIIQDYVGHNADVLVVSVPNELLTPLYCKDHYKSMVMYDFKDWMIMHSEAFKTDRMRDVVVYAPMILDRIPSDEDKRELAKAQLDIFEAAVLAAAPAFTLRFLSIDTFSIRDPAKDVVNMTRYAQQHIPIDDQ